jgi:hypothetical protein
VPDVCFNFNDTPVTLENFDVPSHTVDMHPLPDRFSIVAWRSPLRGLVSVSGSFRDLDDNCANGVLWSIDRDFKTLASGDLPNRTGQRFSLAQVWVRKDDVLYFIVDASLRPRPGPSWALTLP